MSDQKAVADAAEAFAASVSALASRGEDADIPDDVLKRVFTAAIKAYAARVEKHDREPVILDTGHVSATEGVIAACAIIRAIDLNMFDLTMWYNRSGNNRV